MLLFRAILLFLIIFNFNVPIFVYSSFLSVALALGYYLYAYKSIPFYYFYTKHIVVILFVLSLLCILSYLITSHYKVFDVNVTKVFLLQLVMMACLIFVMPAIIRNSESKAFETALTVVCAAFAIQGSIQLLGFLYQPAANFLLSLRTDDLINRLEMGGYFFRGYSLSGSPFFELPAGFGVSFICFFRLMLIKNRAHFNGIWAYVIFFLLLLGSAFSGRTAFTGLVFGVSFYFLSSMSVKTAFKAVTTTAVFTVFLTVVYTFILNDSQRKFLITDVFPFAFEFFYRYEAEGVMRTDSSDMLIESFYYMPDMDVFLWGSGRYNNNDGTYYGHTDAGYMRSLLFGGIFYSIALLIYQLCFFINPISEARSKGIGSRKDSLFMLVLLFHILVVNYKGEALGRMNIMQVLMLFITSTYIINAFKKETEVLA